MRCKGEGFRHRAEACGMANRLAVVAEHRSEVLGEALSSNSARLSSHSQLASHSHLAGVGVSIVHSSGALPGLGTSMRSRVGTETESSPRARDRLSLSRLPVHSFGHILQLFELFHVDLVIRVKGIMQC